MHLRHASACPQGQVDALPAPRGQTWDSTSSSRSDWSLTCSSISCVQIFSLELSCTSFRMASSTDTMASLLSMMNVAKCWGRAGGWSLWAEASLCQEPRPKGCTPGVRGGVPQTEETQRPLRGLCSALENVCGGHGRVLMAPSLLCTNCPTLPASCGRLTTGPLHVLPPHIFPPSRSAWVPPSLSTRCDISATTSLTGLAFYLSSCCTQGRLCSLCDSKDSGCGLTVVSPVLRQCGAHSRPLVNMRVMSELPGPWLAQPSPSQGPPLLSLQARPPRSLGPG